MAPRQSDRRQRQSAPGRLDALIAGPAARRSSHANPFDWTPFSSLPNTGRAFLAEILDLQLVAPVALRMFLAGLGDTAIALTSAEAVGERLVRTELLTPYQLERIQAGNTHGLVLGNYRVIDRLGAGSLAVVFLAEHMLMKRRVAVKVLPVEEDSPPALQERFYAEIEVLADLRHPHVVLAYDAGELPSAGPGFPGLIYLVMELVDGGDLEQLVHDHGPAPIAQACDWIRQAACGLQAAHDRHLIHRDIKPSNMLRTRQGKVQLVDFSLARHFSSVLTSPRALLGSVEFMAPEQSRNASLVGAQADIYGLGASLFWLLTGALPHSPKATVAAAVRALQEEPPLKLRSLRPDVPEALETILDQMLERDPERRPASPLAVLRALHRFSSGVAVEDFDVENAPLMLALPERASNTDKAAERARRVLIVEEDEELCLQIADSLAPLGCRCEYTGDGELALGALWDQRYELVLLAQRLSGSDGYALCRRMRARLHLSHLRIILLLDRTDSLEMNEALTQGADDTLTKPLSLRQLANKVRQELHVKEMLDRYHKLARDLHSANVQLTDSLDLRAEDVRRTQDALLSALAKLAESRDGETACHWQRLQQFSRCPALELAGDSAWDFVRRASFLEQFERCIPLHDIGKLGLPDQLLSKPGPFDDAERSLMQTHTLIGSNLLDTLRHEHGGALAFLGMARAIVRHHHERYDGRGYPDGLVGEEIPHVARLVAVADVYEALRRERFHKPALSHAEAARYILQESAGQFDPRVRQAFAARQRQMERIWREIQD
jgi:response regulator RpfG family c-di-GMP phosphodiesterase